MKEILLIGSMGLLFLIFVQDLRYRAVWWFLFPLVPLLVVCRYFIEGVNFQAWSYSILFNVGFLIINFLILLAWFSFRNVSFRELLNRYLGLGDLLFFVVLAFCVSFPIFPLLFIFSLIGSLICGLLLFRGKTVPLAGLQALMLALFLALDFFDLINTSHINLLYL